MFAAVNIDRMPGGGKRYSPRNHNFVPFFHGSVLFGRGHPAGLAGGLDRGQQPVRGALSDFHRAQGRRKNGSVTFLTSMKALHFRMKQGERNEKTTKKPKQFLVFFT